MPLFYCVSVRLLFWRWREIWTINLGVSGDVPVVNAKNWVIGTHDANDYYDDDDEEEEDNDEKVNRCLARYSPRATTTN